MTDQNSGKGGRYIRDAETGERKLDHRTEAAGLGAPASDKQPAKPVTKGDKK